MGIASSNRIRFLPDIQGLSLPQKLGGWARFFASQITVGVVRALWGWQDTNGNQWIAYGADVASGGAPGAALGAIQCTVSGATGLTTATGSVMDLMPLTASSQYPVSVQAVAGSPNFTITDNNPSAPVPTNGTVYVTNPISVGSVILGVQNSSAAYQVINGGVSYEILATDVLGNPLYAASSTANIAITGVTFTGGTPNTLTITFAATHNFHVGDNVNIIVADNSITGSYIVISSNGTTQCVVATTLSSYTFSTTGSINNSGVVPIYTTVSGSKNITVQFPFHDMEVGEPWYILNPTLVGGITLYGTYTVQTVINGYQFTILAAAAATSTNAIGVYQGSNPVTSGSLAGTTETLHYSIAPFFYNFTPSAFLDGPFLVSGVNPSDWNGWLNLTGSPASGTLTLTNASATGSYVSGGTVSPIGGLGAYVYTQLVTPDSGTASGTFWTLDNWGNDLIAVPGGGAPQINYPSTPLYYQPIYYWDATTTVTAQVLGGSPVINNGAFVAMPQRQIIAWGSSFGGLIDPLLIRWCDINNFNTWVAQVVNQAGSFRLPSGARIVGARQAFQQGIIWTDIEVWSMTYINQPYVYSFNKIGQGCGLIGKYAHGVLNNVVYWMGKSQFFMLSGEGVTILSCPIWDVVFQELDLVNVDKITCGTNAMFNEITWYFPIVGGTGENSNYVKYNVVAGVWDFGVLDRSAWMDVSVLQQPIGFSPVNQYIYQHEISPDADGSAMGETFTTGWFALAEGDVMPYVDQFWPDFHWGYYGQAQSASLTMSFTSQAYPGATEYSYGPYTISQSTTYISPRIRNRLVNFTVNGSGTGTWWRLGGIRYRMQADGKY